MAFDIDAFLKENKAGVAEEEPQLITSEAEPAKQTAFDINAFLQENAVSPTSARGVKETKPSGTSFGEEVSQLGSAFVESIGRPLENMGESFESFGFSGVANALKGAITEPENYVSAGQRFMEPAPDEAQLMGFAWQYAPRAAVEQVGQAIGAIGTRAVGAAAGGAVAGPPGVIAGGFLGPAVFGAAQVIGPVAKERAMNNGREVPNNSDLVAATLTAIGSGSLDAIGAKYLPGGDKATGKFFKRVASAFAGEGLLTEAPQSVIEQIGATAGTEKGLNINVKQAVGEGLIGGTSAAGLTAIVSPFSKPAENQVIRTPEEAEELDINAKANQEAVLLMGDPADQTQNERVTKLKEIESVIANNETLMTGLEPNAPERSKLDLENRVAKKEAEKLKAEITQGAGLSETITEAEKQQIELAKAIAAPEVTPAPTEVIPTEVAVAEAATPVVNQEFKDELEMSGVAYDGDTRYSVQQSSNGTFRAERIVNGKKEDIQIGLPDIEAAQNVILDSVGKEVPAIVAETPTPAAQEAPQQKPSGMSVEESKAYLEERNKSTIFGYPTEDIMAMQQGKQVGRAIPAPVAETPAVTEAPVEVAITEKTPEQQRIALGTKRVGDTAVAAKPSSSNTTLQDFTVGMTPMASKRAIDALNNSVTAEGMPFRRRELVEKDISEGAEVVLSKSGKRRLQRPNGSYRDESQISKTAMDYAEFLIANKSTPAVSETITPATPTPQVEQDIEVGDEASVNLAGRNETVTIARIEDINGVPTAYFDYFGYKSRPLSEMQLAKKSDRNIAKAKRKAEETSKVEEEIKELPAKNFSPSPKTSTAIESQETTNLRNKIKEAKGNDRKIVVMQAMSEGVFFPSAIEAAEFGKPFPSIDKAISSNLPDELKGRIDTSKIKLPVIKSKSPEEAASKLISNDDTRPTLGGVYFDAKNNVVVATDGRALVAIPKKITGGDKIVAARNIKKTTYQAEIKKGQLIDGNYPNWKQVIPTGGNEKVDIDIDDTLKAATILDSLNNTLNNKDEKSLIHFKDARFDPSYILSSVTALVESGAKSITAQIGSKEDPLLLTGNNGSIAVVMPIKSNIAILHPIKARQSKPKLGEKGGVLIPSREDFIQAGQNIYEKGMEFGAWAKQMIQQFGDVVREFLGDVWQAVSGAPAKLNELMGYLPGKGEAGAVNIGRGEKQPAKATEPEAEKPTPKREQVMGKKIGELKDTPKNIISKTKELLRKRVFDPTQVTEQNTTEAFRALGKLTGNKQERRDFADELNDIATIVEDTGAAAEVSMGAALFVNDLFEYAVRLAAQGNKKMLGIMMTNINRLPTGTEGRSDAGRALRAAREMKDTFLTMAKAEQDAFVNYAAEFVYGPNPTQEQIDSIKIGYDAVEKVEEPTAKELEEEIAVVGEKTGTDLVGKINEEFTKATEKGKEKRKTEIEELDSEYKKIQEEADKEIEKLAKIQSDTPSFDPIAARQTANDVRAIVANDLKQRPDMGRKAPWKSMLVAKLQEAGVEVAAAETLADIVWRQHEINNLSRELSSINKAVEKGPISEIVKAIKDTPLEEQQNPNWRYEVMRNYLRMAGLSVAQAERIAKLMDISLQKRFTQAKEQAFTDAISKTAPWKSGNVRSKRAFQQVIQAIRAGALDPSRNMVSDIAALNGWTGFTADQYKVLLKNDAILANKESKDIQKAEAYKAIQDIISKSKLPIRARDVIGQYYDAQALSGIPTLSVNSFSPIAFAMRNAIVEAGSGTIKGDARAIGRAVTTFVDSIKSWANTVAFSFKNNTTVYSNVDYIVNDDNLLRLYRRGVDQFTKGKTPRDRADGVKNMMIGMMDYVRRALNALDYGAIASLQNQNISKYAMAVMKRQKMTDKQANEMFGVMMKAKNDFYLQQIAIGTDKNKASILSDEFYISSWKEALSKAGVKKSEIQQAMDAAINDALSSVGRNRQSLDAFKEESTKLKDAGVASAPALWLLESMANAANQSDSQAKKLFARIIYGYSIVPARVIRETAWFSPYGFVRFGYDAIAKKMGKTSPYAQSLGTDVQYSQRLNEAIAGTVALTALFALRAGSTDDPEDKEEFKIVFTGNGPQRKDDPQFYDSWYKAGNKPNSMIVSFGKTKFALNMMRGFEAFTWPAMMLGALDDLEIRKKQKQKPNSSTEMEDAAIVAGFVFDAALRRGPYAFTTKSLFGTYGDIGVEGVAKGLTFPAKTLIPVLGTSLASNLSNFMNDPIDRRTLDGAVWSNIPFIGPAVAPKSLNAFGEPALSTDMASKMFKLGVPIVFDIPTDRESIKLHELVLKQGGGPSIPTRNQLAQRLDRQPTNKEYEMFVKEYGASLTKSMKSNYNYLFNAKPERYSKQVEKIGLRARDTAERKVKLAARNP